MARAKAETEISSQGFWLYQCLGWSLFALVQLLVLTTDEALSLQTAVPALLLWLLAVAGSLLLRAFWQRLRQPRANAGTRDLASSTALTLGCWLGSAILLAAMLDASHHAVLWALSQGWPVFIGMADAQPLGARAVLLLPLYLAWSALYLMLSRQQQLQQAQQRQLASEQSLQQTQLQTLLMQLNPHFMFNCINNIRALILEDPTAARRMLAHFADMLRYQISADQQVLVPLKTELAVAADYLALMQIQFEHRLKFTQHIDPAALGLLLPKLTLQLLLENAIKHGISQRASGGVIELAVTMGDQPDVWQLTVRNSGQLVSTSEQSTGTGLANLRQRLWLLFADRASLVLQQQAETVLVSLTFSGPPQAPALNEQRHSSV